MEKVRFRGRKYRLPEGSITMIADAVGVSRPTVYRHLLDNVHRSRLSPDKLRLLTYLIAKEKERLQNVTQSSSQTSNEETL